jgi:hypothetical protein
MMMHEKVGGVVIQPRESATPQDMWYVMKPLHGGHPRRLSYHNHMVLMRRLEEIQDEEEQAPTPSPQVKIKRLLQAKSRALGRPVYMR